MQSKLFTNSLYMMLTTASTTFFGFFLWFLAAKIYSPEDIGIATALISSMALIVMLSKLGLDSSIIRFFPSHDKDRIFSTSIIVSTIAVILMGLVFIAGIRIISPELSFLHYPPFALLFLLTIVAGSATVLSCTAFIAIRKASLQFIQSIVVGIRVPLMVILAAFGAMGIYSAFGISFAIALITAYIMLNKYGVKPTVVLDRGFLEESLHFSLGNYISGLFLTGPSLILPIIILNLLGAQEAAYYYIAYAVVTLLLKIPASVSMSLFVEGSHGEKLKKSIAKSFFYVFSLLIPAATALYIFSEQALGLMGELYAIGGTDVLKLMIIASLFTGINSIYITVKRIQKDIPGIIIVSGVTGIAVLGSSYFFLNGYGLSGAGYAWIFGNIAGCVVILLSVTKELKF